LALLWFASDLTGGTTGCLDFIDGSLLSDDHGAIVVKDSLTYFYHLNATSGVAESSPSVIAPDTNAGNKRWELVGVYASTSSLEPRTVNNITDVAFTLTSAYHNQHCDCYNASDQTITIDTLTSAHDGVEIYISKMGAGDVIINLPGSVTFGDGSDQSIKLVEAGYECTLRYNHTRLMMVVTYSGVIV